MGLKHLEDGATVDDLYEDIDYEIRFLRALVERERAAARRAWKKGDKATWRHRHAMARAYQRGITALKFIGCPF